MSKPKFFNLMRITMMSPCLASILGALNAAMNESGSVCIRASRRGISIAFNGKVIAKGATPDEMHERFREAQTKAMAAQTEN